MFSAPSQLQLAAAAATLIPTSPTNGACNLWVQNLDAGDVFLGVSTVTNTSFGIKLVSGAGVNISLPYSPGNPLTGQVYAYHVAGMAAANLHYWET